MSRIWIRINTDCNAPCCPCEIVPEHANGRPIRDLDPILVQPDWDYPGFASSFGWLVASVENEKDPDCKHDGTDGTVPCPSCGLDAGTFIAAAYDFLRDNDGLRVPDPGYFGN